MCVNNDLGEKVLCSECVCFSQIWDDFSPKMRKNT